MKKHDLIIICLAGLVLGIAATCGLGYLFCNHLMVNWGAKTSISIPAIVCHFLMATAVLLLESRK